MIKSILKFLLFIIVFTFSVTFTLAFIEKLGVTVPIIVRALIYVIMSIAILLGNNKLFLGDKQNSKWLTFLCRLLSYNVISFLVYYILIAFSIISTSNYIYILIFNAAFLLIDIVVRIMLKRASENPKVR